MASERLQRRIDILLDEADQAIAQSEWSVVRDRAQNVLALDPDNGDAATFLAAADRALASGSQPPHRLPSPTSLRPTNQPPSPTAVTRSRGSWARAARKKSTWPMTQRWTGK
ncbi:MAG TPA: hypothetical protein EYM54_05180 [Dehalococcoidia bacterium]|nr:hypothetical protein [Dehalococcoidia bacterium]